MNKVIIAQVCFIFQILCSDKIVYSLIDSYGKEELGAGNGLTRDVYGMFWSDAMESYFIGADQRVPLIRHDLYLDEWRAIGTILVKGFIDVGYFPIQINKCFTNYCIFGEVSDDEIIEGFLSYVSRDERETLQNALNASKDIESDQSVFQSEEIFEILEEFKCRKLITHSNARELICELGRQELHQKPHIVTSCWGPILRKL